MGCVDDHVEARVKARTQFFDRREIGCLTGRAWLYLQGEKPPIYNLGGTLSAILPVACGRTDTQRFIGWAEVEALERGEPMVFEVTCADCSRCGTHSNGRPRSNDASSQ